METKAVHGEHPSVPFLEMLQGEMQRASKVSAAEEAGRHCPSESGFQFLLRLQEQRFQGEPTPPEPESCVTHASNSGSHAPLLVSQNKKRKRPVRAVKSGGPMRVEAESQRMTHIVVERNRRRLMNDQLSALRSLMPSSFVQRGDQASIIGGAIDFVKELEQLFLLLQAEKTARTASKTEENWSPASSAASGFFISPQYRGYSLARRGGEDDEAGVDVEATVVQGHVNLKVAGRRREGQLMRAIAAMEDLRLTVLHLTITSLDTLSILYSINLKVEDDCRLRTADEIAAAVHRIFSIGH
ncbi:hypothetical protein HPP92_025997 [Vanilla planifolia]|uniref:BHLH domain-containing protein n=1 Tax=Vanilla planifolia TaxID=51239 RepID=A0A835PL39_VANPL|nr:hypothetical protein HPP92_025997 [Vanilla planifolia]